MFRLNVLQIALCITLSLQSLNKQTAIQLLYMDKECSDYCMKVSGDKYIADDLMQYSFEQLLLKDESFILSKYADGSLKRYFSGIAYKSFNYPSSPFYIEHLKLNTLSSEVQDFEEDVEVDTLKFLDENILEKEILAYERRSEKNWYEASILRLYFKYKTLRELSKAVKIPISSLHISINNIKTYLKETICEKYC